MADHIRYNVSCELIDEYTQNVTFSDDDSADLIPLESATPTLSNLESIVADSGTKSVQLEVFIASSVS